MNEEQIRLLLRDFRQSQHYNQYRPIRKERHEYNHGWITPSNVKTIPKDELRSKFLEYYSGGEGRQVLNQIWRDRIIRDEDKFREMLTYLLDENTTLEERFSNVVGSSGKKHIAGVGRALASAFLMSFNLQKHCIWNSKTEMGFNVLGWGSPYQSSDDEGTRYAKVLEQLRKLRDEVASELSFDFDEVDNFLHWISAEEEGKIAVKNRAGEDSLAKAGIGLEPPEELFVQKLIERNFDKIFAPLNLKLYDGDPNQSGAKFSTPAGIMDFLAEEKNTKDLVVVELKVGKAYDSAVGQISRYVGYLTKELAGEKNVRGIILAEDMDDKAKYALNILPGIEFRKYRLDLKVV